MNPLKSSIQQRANKKFKGSKDFYEKNITLYLMAWVFGIAALIVSGITTYQYFINSLATFETSFYNQILAFSFAAAQSGLLGYLATRITQDLFRQEWYWLTTVLTLAFISLSGWNLYTDFIGSKDLATAVTSKPIDSRTSSTDETYKGQIQAAEKQQKAISDKIAYIKRGCKTEDCYVPGGKAYWKGNITNFGRKELRRLEGEKESKSKQIASIQSSFTKEREASTALFSNSLVDWENKRDRRMNNFRGLVLIALIFLILSSLYKEYFESQIEKDMNKEPDPSGTPGPGNKISRVEELEREIRQILAENNHHTSSHNGHRADNVYPMNSPHTRRVAPDTRRVLEGKGFPYECDYCGDDYFAKREIKDDHHKFCCNEHRTAYWSEAKKEERKASST